MALWDTLGRLQDYFKGSNNPSATDPFNIDGRVKFGTSLDVARNLPESPAKFTSSVNQAKNKLAQMNIDASAKPFSANDAAEQARLTAINAAALTLGKPAGIAAGAAIGSVIPGVGTGIGAAVGATAYGVAELDKVTDGKVSQALMSGTKGVRSNYAFVRDIEKKNTGMGLLAGMSILGGAAAGAAAGFAVGGVGAIPGAAIGAIGAALGGYGAGKAGRVAAEAGLFDAIDKDIKKSAKFAQAAEGQETYNFGNDTTRLASVFTGVKTLGDTSKGIGAITSGLLNFGFETALAPDIKALQAGGKVARAATVGGITAKTEGVVGQQLQKAWREGERSAERLVKNVDLLKRTAAGEKTPYTPVLKFYQDNDAITIQQRPEFRNNEYGQVGAVLVAGKTPQESSLVLRIGQGDKTAIDELQVKHPATFAELMRYEGMIDIVESAGSQRAAYGFSRGGETIVLSKNLPDNTKIIEAELADLRGQYAWLDKTLRLDSALQERTVSRVPLIEALRNDIAKQRIANKLEVNKKDISTRDTRLGKAMQTLYQRNGLGVLVRKIDRWTDDAPHSTINFNDAIQSSTRVRTTIRAGVVAKVIVPEEGLKFYNDFTVARTEGQKLELINSLTDTIFSRIADKYGVPVEIKDVVLAQYSKIIRDNTNKAKSASAENRAYMIDEAGEVIEDPQLISQLANGGYLPPVEFIDKAFKRYSKKFGAEGKLPINTAILGKAVVDEFQSIWRLLTLARTGFPINIMRDSTLRTWADGAMFYSLKELGKDALDDITSANTSVSKIKRWGKGMVDKDANMANVRYQIKIREDAIKAVQPSLKRAGYDPANPPKEISPEIQKQLNYIDEVNKGINELRRQENALVKNIPSKVVGRDKVNIDGYDFPAPFSGRFGEISKAKIQGKSDIRGLLASTRELELANIRRDREGGKWIEAVENEDLHIRAWDNVLNNLLRNDKVAEKIMQGVPEKDIIDWIKSPASGLYTERFGIVKELGRPLKISDSKYIYNRVLSAVNQFAPDLKLQKLVAEGKINTLELKKMYPDVASRPGVSTDMALDMVGRSNGIRFWSDLAKDAVTWLATQPTSKLSYNPYFAAKYQHKLQSMVAVANAQGRKLSDMSIEQFEATARAYALNEFRAKINSFNRDMNYPSLVNYIIAFFPAVVEQYRAYGRIAMENPEFPLRIAQMARIPEYIGQVQTDPYGTEYVEVTLPLLGGLKGRLPTSWFNPVNPTGGQIISAGPLGQYAANAVAKRVKLPEVFMERVLPFGVQSNTLGALTPNTLRRAGQAFGIFFLKDNGAQYNKDLNMFIEMKRFEFERDNDGRQPTAAELTQIKKEASSDSIGLSILRALSAGILPLQPRYVSPLQKYADILSQYNKEYGADGAERFSQDFPDYYLLSDSLSDKTSGIRADDTSVELVKKNGSTVELMIAQLGEKADLTVLGAVFNDDDYAFSGSAQAYLMTNAIPGTRKKFTEQAAALENNRSSIVNKGWQDWTKMKEIVSQAIESNNPPYNPASGYGKTILDAYKDSFIEQMKTQNNLWYEEKKNPGFETKINNTIKVLTIAANTPKMWADLSKQTRWHSVANYLNFRYDIHDELKRRGVTIASKEASDLREQVENFTYALRKQDVNFGKFYDRYFEDDSFSYVYEEPQFTGGKK
jgi:hypothetical protein